MSTHVIQLLLSDVTKYNRSKLTTFRMLMRLEIERRAMTAEASNERFLLSEITERCIRPRHRAFLMLRLCQLYHHAHGQPVLFSRKPLQPLKLHVASKARTAQAAVNQTQPHAATHTAAPKHTDNFHRKHSSFSQQPHRIAVICRSGIQGGQ